MSVSKWFGDAFADRDARLKSYDLIEDFIAKSHRNWSLAPNTDKIATEFEREVRAYDDSRFAFLLCHTGYIPETYAADSSQETLFSKLVEVVVGEWARRIGFDKTRLPTAKSSVEDVTISDGRHVIVCDAKSFRLGRSQKAPNVKDALKQGDILKWLEKYPSPQRLGGLVTFPSQHDWSSGSDVYLYLTDKSSPIVLLFYEHLAMMMMAGGGKDRIFNYFARHAEHFPNTIGKKEGNRSLYFSIIEKELISAGGWSWNLFYPVSDFIIRERVSHAIERLDTHLATARSEVEAQVKAMEADELRGELVEARVALRVVHLKRQIDNIRRFRSVLN